jgi:hypothetical protein
MYVKVRSEEKDIERQGDPFQEISPRSTKTELGLKTRIMRDLLSYVQNFTCRTSVHERTHICQFMRITHSLSRLS